jgi:hypothetical protein
MDHALSSRILPDGAGQDNARGSLRKPERAGCHKASIIDEMVPDGARLRLREPTNCSEITSHGSDPRNSSHLAASGDILLHPPRHVLLMSLNFMLGHLSLRERGKHS